MSNQRIIHFTLVPLTALALLATLVFLTASRPAPVQAADRAPSGPEWQQKSSNMSMTGTLPMTDTMPMTGTLPAMMNQMMQQMQTMMRQNMGMMGAMPMRQPGMGANMIMMGQMMQMMGQMQDMMSAGMGAMGSGMPMTNTITMDQAAMDQMMGNMAQMMQTMMAQMQNMMGPMGGTMPITGTLPTTGTVPGTSTSNLTQTAQAGAVTVKVTPLNLQNAEAKTLDFEVVLDTHSVELDVDLAKTATLQVDDTQIEPTAWKSASGKAHHVEGVLSFPATDAAGESILKGTKTISLLIGSLPGKHELTFTWNLTASAVAAPQAKTIQGSVWVADETGNSISNSKSEISP